MSTFLDKIKEQTECMNAEAASEIANELFALEQCQKKLLRYISLLESSGGNCQTGIFGEGACERCCGAVWSDPAYH